MENEKKILTIDEVKNIELDILEVIDKICNLKKFNYYMCGGTMLGTIRHKGFIPWDDDIDIFLPRKDFDKFISYMKKQQDYKYLSVIDDDIPIYFYPFAKIVDNRTIAKMEDNVTEHGIWVDVFPIDYLPNDKKKRIKLIKKCYLYRSLIISMTTDFKTMPFSKKKVVKQILNLYSNVVGKKRIYNRYKKIINNSSKIKDSDYVACLCPTYKEREIFEASKLFKRKKYKFEKKEFWGPENYEYYLSNLYGNYMKLPPKEKRRVHGIKAWYK